MLINGIKGDLKGCNFVPQLHKIMLKRSKKVRVLELDKKRSIT
tara:strand:- start:418 stop:546 length:129 start_codon:yes stop_codon:yes gene_type:complete